MLIRHDRALLALDIMLDVAFHAGRGVVVTGAAEIAERLGMARRGIEPALQALVRAGLLESLRGPRGGYRLGRAPRAITLLEAAMANSEEDAATTDATGLLSTAVIQPLWQELDASLRDRLGALTLHDLLQRAGAKGLRRPVTEPLNFAI